MLEKPVLLVVDDEEDLLEALQLNLELNGFEVLAVNSGNKAFEVFLKEHVDAILTDIKMPDGNGIELLKNVKRENRNLPVVSFISGYSDLTPREAYHLGASATLSKPFDMKTLAEKLHWDIRSVEERWQWTGAKEDTLEEVSGDIQLGRGGVCMPQSLVNRSETSNEVLSLEINLNPLGRIKARLWPRWEDEKSGLVGLEFKEMDQLGLELFQKYLREVDPLPYIPKNTNPF